MLTRTLRTRFVSPLCSSARPLKTMVSDMVVSVWVSNFVRLAKVNLLTIALRQKCPLKNLSKWRTNMLQESKQIYEAFYFFTNTLVVTLLYLLYSQKLLVFMLGILRAKSTWIFCLHILQLIKVTAIL